MEFYSLLTVVIVLSLFLVGIGAVIAVEQSTTASVTVNDFLSVTLTNVPVTFPSMNPGETKNASVGFPLNATIGSESNVNANVTTKTNQTNFVSGSNTFNVGNMTWGNATTGPWTAYSTSGAKVCSNVAASGTCKIYHQLTIPSAQAAGTYETGITITATKS